MNERVILTKVFLSQDILLVVLVLAAANKITNVFSPTGKEGIEIPYNKKDIIS